MPKKSDDLCGLKKALAKDLESSKRNSMQMDVYKANYETAGGIQKLRYK